MRINSDLDVLALEEANEAGVLEAVNIVVLVCLIFLEVVEVFTGLVELWFSNAGVVFVDGEVVVFGLEV